jgi:hypothetical protein
MNVAPYKFFLKPTAIISQNFAAINGPQLNSSSDNIDLEQSTFGVSIIDHGQSH